MSESKKLYIYRSGPIDYFDDFRSLFSASYFLYKEEMEDGERGYNTSKRLHQLNMLLFDVINHAKNYFHDPRGVPFHYAFVSPKNDFGWFPVIIYKEDNNGTMYAFCWEKDMENSIPHEFEDEWDLIDIKEWRDGRN